MYTEVARRCARQGLTHVAGVLRGIPVEFVTGVGRNRNDAELLCDSSIIGLTVAGVAACHGTVEILSAFLDCVTSAERSLSEPPKRSSERLGDLLGTRDISPPPEPIWWAKFSYPNSSGQRQVSSVASQHLLRLLLESEPVGFKNLRAPVGGHWTATFDQRVSTFASVLNLNDYWSLRPKQSRGPVKLNAKEQRKARLITHPGLLLTTLMEWVYWSSDGSITKVVWPQGSFSTDIDPEIIDEALRQLESAGQVRFAVSTSPQTFMEKLLAKGPGVVLTVAGIAHRKEISVLRGRAARNALLAFAHQEEGKSIIKIPEDFLRSSFDSTGGYLFSAADVLSASQYLLDKGLVVGDDRYVESARARGIQRLTANGNDCVEQGGDVAEYLKHIGQGVKYQNTTNANIPQAGDGGIFISYRRQEASQLAGRLSDCLVDRFGKGRVFLDVDAIEPGADFAEEISRAVAACQVLLVVIGPNWLTVTDERSRRRLDDPDDIVRLEIEAALTRDVRVIPILVEGAVMPGRQDLPESLVRLGRLNALHIRHESFRSDAGRLVTAIERVLAATSDTVDHPG